MGLLHKDFNKHNIKINLKAAHLPQAIVSKILKARMTIKILKAKMHKVRMAVKILLKMAVKSPGPKAEFKKHKTREELKMLRAKMLKTSQKFKMLRAKMQKILKA